MKNSFKYFIAAAVLAFSPVAAFAAEEEAAATEVEETGSKYKGKLGLSVDLTSTTLWRGSYLTGVSLQQDCTCFMYRNCAVLTSLESACNPESVLT